MFYVCWYVFFGLSMLVRFCYLGPLLFVIYSSKLFSIVNKHLPNVNAYADDNQFKPVDYTNETAAVSSVTILYPWCTELDVGITFSIFATCFGGFLFL